MYGCLLYDSLSSVDFKFIFVQGYEFRYEYRVKRATLTPFP